MRIYIFFVIVLILGGCAEKTTKTDYAIKRAPARRIDAVFKTSKQTIIESINDIVLIYKLEKWYVFVDSHKLLFYDRLADKVLWDFEIDGFLPDVDERSTCVFPWVVPGDAKFICVNFLRNTSVSDKQSKITSRLVCFDLARKKVAWEDEVSGNNIRTTGNGRFLKINNTRYFRLLDVITGKHCDIGGAYEAKVWLSDSKKTIMTTYYEKNLETFIERRTPDFRIEWRIYNGSPGGGPFLPICEAFEIPKIPEIFFAYKCYEETDGLSAYTHDGKELWLLGVDSRIIDKENLQLITARYENDNHLADKIVIKSYSLIDGRVLWTSKPISHNRETFSWVLANLSLQDESVYVGSSDSICKLDLKTGKTIFTLDKSNALVKDLSTFNIYGSIDGKVVVSGLRQEEYDKACETNHQVDKGQYERYFKMNPQNGQLSAIDTETIDIEGYKEAVYGKFFDSRTKNMLDIGEIQNQMETERQKSNNQASFYIINVFDGIRVIDCNTFKTTAKLAADSFQSTDIDIESADNGLIATEKKLLIRPDDVLSILVKTITGNGKHQIQLWKVQF